VSRSRLAKHEWSCEENAMQCNAMQCDAMRCDAMRCNDAVEKGGSKNFTR